MTTCYCGEPRDDTYCLCCNCPLSDLDELKAIVRRLPRDDDGYVDVTTVVPRVNNTIPLFQSIEVFWDENPLSDNNPVLLHVTWHRKSWSGSIWIPGKVFRSRHTNRLTVHPAIAGPMLPIVTENTEAMLRHVSTWQDALPLILAIALMQREL